VIPFEFRHDLWRQKTSHGAIVRRCLRDPMFSRFDTIPECDRQTHRHTTTAYTALSIASRSKNDTDIADYNFNAQQLILVIFGRDIAERICY